MAKLYFRYGAMGASKTANALMVRYNYIEKGQPVALVKPGVEDRDGKKIIRSRIGLEAACELFEEFEKHPVSEIQQYAAVIVDEAQFLTAKQVDFLSDLVDLYDIPVLCYGLRTDFQMNFFEGSRRLMEIADVIEEVPTVCWCGRRAQTNARICNGRIVHEGSQVQMGGNESYVALCRRHYKQNMIRKPE